MQDQPKLTQKLNTNKLAKKEKKKKTRKNHKENEHNLLFMLDKLKRIYYKKWHYIFSVELSHKSVHSFHIQLILERCNNVVNET